MDGSHARWHVDRTRLCAISHRARTRAAIIPFSTCCKNSVGACPAPDIHFTNGSRSKWDMLSRLPSLCFESEGRPRPSCVDNWQKAMGTSMTRDFNRHNGILDSILQILRWKDLPWLASISVVSLYGFSPFCYAPSNGCKRYFRLCVDGPRRAGGWLGKFNQQCDTCGVSHSAKSIPYLRPRLHERRTCVDTYSSRSLG